jgi:hypothetical protein
VGEKIWSVGPDCEPVSGQRRRRGNAVRLVLTGDGIFGPQCAAWLVWRRADGGDVSRCVVSHSEGVGSTDLVVVTFGEPCFAERPLLGGTDHDRGGGG